MWLNPFPNEKILDFPKLGEFAHDNFKFDENGRKFSKWVENNMEKRRKCSNQQFFLFPLCFQILEQQTRKNKGLFGKGLNGKNCL